MIIYVIMLDNRYYGYSDGYGSWLTPRFKEAYYYESHEDAFIALLTADCHLSEQDGKALQSKGVIKKVTITKEDA